jgi:hypothetical protein
MKNRLRVTRWLAIVAVVMACLGGLASLPSSAQNQLPAGKYQLIRGALATPSGPQDVTLRIDSDTGDTWVLIFDRNPAGAKWVRVPG